MFGDLLIPLTEVNGPRIGSWPIRGTGPADLMRLLLIFLLYGDSNDSLSMPLRKLRKGVSGVFATPSFGVYTWRLDALQFISYSPGPMGKLSLGMTVDPTIWDSTHDVLESGENPRLLISGRNGMPDSFPLLSSMKTAGWAVCQMSNVPLYQQKEQRLLVTRSEPVADGD